MAFLSSFKMPEDDDKYVWTRHVKQKMIYYAISASRVKRVVRHPERMEKGIAPGTIAVMQPANTKKTQEYWVMYVDLRKPSKRTRSTSSGSSPSARKKIITAWRYPGVSPVRETIPIPDEIVRELEESGDLDNLDTDE